MYDEVQARPVYDEVQARRLARDHGWTFAPDGERWRRVVASPLSARIVEQPTVELLLRAGRIVICGGGGGAPVADDGSGGLHGAEAVVDKDLTSALLAVGLGADHLLVLTDVPAVMDHFGTPEAAQLRRLRLDELGDRHFPAGSMGPKIDACARFVTATGRPATIGALPDAAALLDGTAGTTVCPAPVGVGTVTADPAAGRLR